MRYLALDPGGTTGWAYYNSEEPGVGIGYWERGELGPGDHHEALWMLMSTLQPDVLIYERFMYQRRELDRGVSLRLDSVEYIGVVKLWMKVGRTIDVKLVEQTPAQAKNLWDDRKLELVGLKTGSAHTKDATRHLLYYLTVTEGNRSWINQTKPVG